MRKPGTRCRSDSELAVRDFENDCLQGPSSGRGGRHLGLVRAGLASTAGWVQPQPSALAWFYPADLISSHLISHPTV